MADYLTHLDQMYNQLSFKRKVDYIKYNLSFIFDNLNKKNTSILEVGPGMGEMVYFLNKLKIYDVDVVDNDRSILNYIKSSYKIKNSYLNENLSQFDGKLRLYDAIILIQVFEHLPINTYKEVLTTLFKHLKKGGIIVIVVPNANNPLGMSERYGDLQHYNSFTEQSLRDLINLAGIRDSEIQIKGYEIPPVDLLNIIRIFFQKILHLMLLLIMIINGGLFFKTMTPNITLFIKKT